MILIFIAIIILFILAVIGTYLYYKKRILFNKHKSIFEFWGIIIPILLALLAFLQTQSAIESSTDEFKNIVRRMDAIITKAEESTSSLHNVDQSLSKLPQQMDAFSESIKSFNDVIASQRDLLNITLNGLNGSIFSFKSSVDTMVERFNRKPSLSINMNIWADDTSRTIMNVVITNYGSLMADVNILRFQIPKEYLIKFEMLDGYLESDVNGILYYQVNFPPPSISIIADTTKPRKLSCNIVLNKEAFDMRILVYYKADFGNDGSNDQVFSFQKDVEKPKLLRHRK